jgi:hypothetical protein
MAFWRAKDALTRSSKSGEGSMIAAIVLALLVVSRLSQRLDAEAIANVALQQR